ncbi:VIT1/CCC1 transporter family protein [Methylocapsa polymorpha]|uniref:VIT1/CCC1 transporter family protein n=1 Tax=Methylocapsa polymorpha TaxID=3080828 RepID=A0ABZ0HLC5_9HYPH|nr:VIT1/CCC1 transporter family protein [Methylocapsa sp. RX1]
MTLGLRATASRSRRPDARSKSALTIGGAYVIGGLIAPVPLFLREGSFAGASHFNCGHIDGALHFWRRHGQMTGVAPLRSALQTAIVGGLAAAAAFALARLVGG